MSDCALHLSRPHQRSIKYFTAFFELAWDGYYATTITKLFAKITICCVQENSLYQSHLVITTSDHNR